MVVGGLVVSKMWQSRFWCLSAFCRDYVTEVPCFDFGIYRFRVLSTHYRTFPVQFLRIPTITVFLEKKMVQA
jgi:hypothetical protein